MKIESKFRVWDGEKMVYDVMAGKFGVFYVSPENNGLNINDNASITPLTTKYPDDTPLMRFSGMHDKNGDGVEIYEGDILAFPEDDLLVEVVFKYGCFIIQNIKKTKEFDHDYLKHASYRGAYVVGNIFENPELVEERK